MREAKIRMLISQKKTPDSYEIMRLDIGNNEGEIKPREKCSSGGSGDAINTTKYVNDAVISSSHPKGLFK
jgi:hypothetical protein